MASYGVTADETDLLEPVLAAARKAVPQTHRDFLSHLPLMHVTDDLVFVHAGIRPGVALEKQVEEDLIWIRQGFIDDQTDHGHQTAHKDHPRYAYLRRDATRYKTAEEKACSDRAQPDPKHRR